LSLMTDVHSDTDKLGAALLRLNPQQREAVLESLQGNSLVIAGAGSGKTATKTVRIAYLIQEHQVPPWRIMLLTFTNKASREMIERTAQIIGQDAHQIMSGTFHSVCMKLLRRPEVLPHLGFAQRVTIYDQSECSSLIKDICKEIGLDHDRQYVSVIQSQISEWKNNLMTPRMAEEQLLILPNSTIEKACHRVYQRYQARLTKSCAMDFDDIIMKTVHLLETVPDFRDYCHQRFRHISVDEFQDTNWAQYMLIKRLKGPDCTLLVVGDDSQSIYGWRGADIKNILNFDKDYGAKVFRLEQNYRSTQTIVNAANALIGHNKTQIAKTCFSQKEIGDAICIHTAKTSYAEADFIAREINNLIRAGAKASDIAVLYRASWLTRVIERALTDAKIPYEVVNGLAFYERMCIKDSAALLNLAVNPDDSVNAKRVLGKVPGIAEVTAKKAVEEIQELADQQDLSIMAAARHWVLQGKASKTRSAISSFLASWPKVVMTAENGNISDTLRAAWAALGYQEYIKKQSKNPQVYQDNIDNLREFWRMAKDWETQTSENTLFDFLENMALVSQTDKNTSIETVKLQTLHSSKGLEFPVVFMVGMEEGIFPSKNSFTEAKMDEDRRLAYVGVTRAKDQLYMTHALERPFFKDIMFNRPSRFIAEIPDQYRAFIL
jgi:DNA helicase-2/ATP-dependent DNA helicase PcrA